MIPPDPWGQAPTLGSSPEKASKIPTLKPQTAIPVARRRYISNIAAKRILKRLISTTPKQAELFDAQQHKSRIRERDALTHLILPKTKREGAIDKIK